MSTADDFVRGDASDLMLPTHANSLRRAGPAFLTDALQFFGALSRDNAVTAITNIAPCDQGNSGQKVFLSVEYARPETAPPRNLFVKFSRDFADPFRDRRRYELESEVRLAALSRHPHFPVRTPRAAFADFNYASGSGVLITERVIFGADGVQPPRPKCMDHELADARSYYHATITALAKLAAAHKSGRLSPELETLFPFDHTAAAADLPLLWSEAQLQDKVTAFEDFARRCPRLLPAPLTSGVFIEKWREQVRAFAHRDADVRRFLHTDPAFIALCHWNTNIDNAWFWTGDDGALQCGLLDWGMVRQMNVAYGLWGGLSAADPSMLTQHLDALLDLFRAELNANGGPSLDRQRVQMHFDLSLATLGLALMMDVPSLVLQRLPEVEAARDVHDPILHHDEVARCFLHVFTNFLELWRTRDFGASLAKI